MSGRLAVLCVLIAAAAMAAAGCATLEKDYPDRRYFALEIERPGPPAPRADGPPLEIRRFRVSPRYDNRSLVYRIGDVRYQTDFYNQFLITPGPMITESAAKWLNDAGIFSSVLAAGGQVLPEYVLEGSVNELYGDYRNRENPAAAIEIQFFLIRTDRPEGRVVWQKAFERKFPLDENGPEGLVLAWNKGLASIMAEVERELKTMR